MMNRWLSLAILPLSIVLSVSDDRTLDSHETYAAASLRNRAPENAAILTQYSRVCNASSAPTQVKGRAALLCRFSLALSSSCLDPGQPVFIGRHCKGRTCKLSWPTDDATCLIQAHGGRVDPKNETLKATCGVESNRPDAFYKPTPLPGTVPLGDSPIDNCARPVPVGVSAVSINRCRNGKPAVNIRLQFDESFVILEGVKYTCLIMSACYSGHYSPQFLCYYENGDAVLQGNVKENSGVGVTPGFWSHCAFVWAFIVGLFLL